MQMDVTENIMHYFYNSCPSCSRTDERADETAALQQVIRRLLLPAHLVVFVSWSACCIKASLSGID